MPNSACCEHTQSIPPRKQACSGPLERTQRDERSNVESLLRLFYRFHYVICITAPDSSQQSTFAHSHPERGSFDSGQHFSFEEGEDGNNDDSETGQNLANNDGLLYGVLI